jgi:hypothetical protein
MTSVLNGGIGDSGVVRILSVLVFVNALDDNPRRRRRGVRIYKQLPHLGTEFGDHATRANQARAWTPPELVAYKTLLHRYLTEA